MEKKYLMKYSSHMQSNKRFCGVLIHPTSFPSPYGIGDLGIEARKILSLMSQAGLHLWQILPLGPTGYGDSPYSSRSCFAGNELLIDIRSLNTLFSDIKLDYPDPCPDRCSRVNYPAVFAHKMVYLKEIASQFAKKHSTDPDYVNFCSENAWWLDDYALYKSLTDRFNDSRWFLWPDDLKNRKKTALNKWRKELAAEIQVVKALQYFFFSQWNSLHKFANEIGIQIIGDLPIFAASDSVDVWANQRLFKLDAQGNQTALAGCPPDAFSPTGQLWGNPVYNWKEHEKDDFTWWRSRVESSLKLVDILRIDHFRGFESYWETPAGETTAVNGKWMPGPGMRLLGYFKGKNIIAEDLGVITPEVRKLQEDSGFPGMRVYQFAFDLSKGYFDTSNAYLPHNFIKNCVAYTGTHDNETTLGWYSWQSDAYKDLIRRYLQCPDNEVVWQMMRSLLASSANYVIFPMQDIMGLDNSARMNQPSTVGSSNWSWRMNPSNLEDWKLNRLREYIQLYGRA